MFSKITRKNLDVFLRKYSSKRKVLDIGSGGSAYDRYFPNRITVDIDPERKPEIVADIHKMPFGDGEFEMVLCTEVLEHTLDPKVAIREIKRVLKKDGLLILSTRFVYPLHDIPNDYWRFTYFGMKKLFEDWEVVELVPETKTFSAMGALLQRVGFQTKLRFNYLSKLFIYLLAKVFEKLDFLILSEYGDIKKKSEASNIMATGYYIVVRKK